MSQLLFLLLFSVAFSTGSDNASSTHCITGSVLDESGVPIIGANVYDLESTSGTTTDFDGKFRLCADTRINTISVSYTGYRSEVIKVRGRDSIQVSLQQGVLLDEVQIIQHGVSRYKTASYTQSEEAGSRPQGVQHKMYSDQGYVQFNTEDYGLIIENAFKTPKNAPLSTFSVDTDGASYANLRRMLKNGQMPPVDAVRIEEMINYFDYDYNTLDGDHPFAVESAVGVCPWNEEHKLVHIGLQGKNINTQDLPASNLVFLIDVSGSMQAPNKLQLVKASFKLLVSQLRAQDRVSIVTYAGSTKVVLESTAGSEGQVILDALEGLFAGGSTSGAAGIDLAYEQASSNFIKGGNNRVILATDGDFNVGQSSDAELVRIIEEKRESGIFLSVLGYGTGNYKDNKMQQLANHGNGNHAYIDDITEARKVFVSEFGGTLFTIAKDVKLQVEFNPSEVAAYRLIGYENRLLNDEDFNDDKKDAGEIGSGHTVTALYEIIPVGVKSDFIKEVDDLRYQKEPKTVNATSRSNELMYVKLRYKQPQGSKSILLDHTIQTGASSGATSDDNFRWSAAVAMYGQLLRDSEFKGDSDYDQVLELAKSAVGQDRHGYRHEFIRLVESVRPLSELQAQR